MLRFLRHPNIIRWEARGGKECAASVLYDHDSNYYSRDADAASISYDCCDGWCWCCRFEEFAEDRTNYYLVMELVKVGTGVMMEATGKGWSHWC